MDNGPWIKSHLKKGSMYLTAAGAPYEFRWKTLIPEPFEVTVVVISLSLFNEALEEVFGKQAANARLKDVSGFQDAQLTALLQPLRDEAFRRSSSRLLVRGRGQAVALYLVINYTVLESESPSGAPALPNFKLQRVTRWMADHLAEEFNLATLAKQAGISDFHFIRLFKRATGVPPSQYHIQLRINAAKQLLRETKKSVITIANDIGYTIPSAFARVFRKETGVTPTEYRRQR